jgi:FG-GAP-like repeat/FG-GAP repeat
MKGRSAQINRAVRGILTLLVSCLLITACNLVLGPHVFVDCVQQSDCKTNQACGTRGRCYCAKLSFLGPLGPPAYSTGNRPWSVAAMDLNGDGKLDLAVANANGDDMNPDGSVSVLFGNGDGNFKSQVSSYPTGKHPRSVAAMDLNGDGKLDLAVANANGDDMNPDGSVCVLLGKGDDTFNPQVTYRTGNSPESVAAMDLNGDGKPDLAVANAQGDAMNPDGSVSVLLGKGDGTFKPHVTYRTGTSPVSVLAVDLNGNGKPDLAVANAQGDAMNPEGSVSVLLGNGDGTFEPQVTYATSEHAFSLIALDLNGDSKPDLAAGNSGGLGTRANGVSVLLGKGDGTFKAPVTYPTGNGLSAVVARDLNGDGMPDFAVANSSDDTIGVLLNNGDGTFQPQGSYPTGTRPSSVVALDLNGDGKPDLATTNGDDNTVTVLLNTCP